MGAVNQNGIYIYSPEDTVSTWEGLLNLGMNSVSNVVSGLRLNSVYKTSSVSGANTIRDQLVASGVTPSAASPILVYNTTNGKFMAWDGATWKLNGDDLSKWMTTADKVLTPAAPVTGALNWGSVGSAEKLRMESGTAVSRVEYISAQRTGHAYFGLKNYYTGISTVICSNGDAEAFGRVISADDNNWPTVVVDSTTVCNRIRTLCPGATRGQLVRINYIVIGWVK